MERETGIEPATNGLGSRYSTIELLPLRLIPDLSRNRVGICITGGAISIRVIAKRHENLGAVVATVECNYERGAKMLHL